MISIIEFINVYSLIGCVIVLLWYYNKSKRNYWRKLNVNDKKSIPVFGNISKFIMMQEAYFETLHKLYMYFEDEPYGGFYQMTSPTLLLKDPELITQILISDFKHFYDRGFEFVYVNKKLNPLSCHLFLANGERWRILRQKMSPVFTSGKLKAMYEQIFACIKLMNEYIAANVSDNIVGSDINLKELFERLTIDVIGTCAFGIECNSLKSNDQFRSKGVEVFKPRIINVIKMFLAVINKNLLHYFKIGDMKKDVQDFFLNTIYDTIMYRKSNGVSRNDILQMLMDLQNTYTNPKYAPQNLQNNILTNEEFDEIDIAANAFLFFIAGFETTATTLSYCLYELALNTKIQDKLRKEVQDLQNKQQKIGPHDLKELKYMDAVISETLRKYPILPLLNREITEAFEFSKSKLQLPVGTKIIIPTWSIHHDRKYYPDPEMFDPERFNPENKSRIINGTYIPFGDGPRYCIGKRFAQMEIKATLTDIILKYNFSPCSKTQIPIKYKEGTIMLSPSVGPWLNFTKRKV